MALKKNRSNKLTTGLCNTFRDSKLKVLFFELDKEHSEFYNVVKNVFDKYELDFFTHLTGSKGHHFLSPTLMTTGRWHYIIQEIKHINPKCPMTTLRVKPNKYYQEDYFWYQIVDQTHWGNDRINSIEMCQYLNHIFKTNFNGKINTELNIVSYPLPISNYVR